VSQDNLELARRLTEAFNRTFAEGTPDLRVTILDHAATIKCRSPRAGRGSRTARVLPSPRRSRDGEAGLPPSGHAARRDSDLAQVASREMGAGAGAGAEAVTSPPEIVHVR
jgi:hypothetical protein